MRMWETTDAFPFKTLRGLGGALLGFGIALLGLGAFDVIWTVVKYTDEYEDCPDDWDSNLDDPCDNDELVWTWTAEGIWGGFLILLVGILGLLFSRWRVRSLRLQRDMFGIGCILLIFPICPAIIALSVLELYYGDDIFYYNDSGDDELKTGDIAKFIVPLLVGFMSFLTWLFAIAGASVACCCANIAVQETVYGDKSPIVAGAQQPQMIQAIAPQQQQQQTQYEVVAIAQPTPPPYFVSAPLGAPPPMGPPMGHPMMGPPMMGHPMMGPPMGHPMMGPPMGHPMMGPPMGYPTMGPPPFGPHRGRFGPPALMPPPEAYM